ncbi:MAG: hypothetical protein OHK0024_24430 [Thalassobaculales bacterium]
MRGDAAAFGIALPDAPGAAAYAVWPENEPVLRAFLCCHTQWRRQLVVGLGAAAVMWMGLDYAGVAAGLRQARIRLTPAQWEDLQAMEAAALTELNRS